MKHETFDETQIFAIERPDPQLMKYYFLQSLAALPAILIVLPVNYFRYHTMKYRFDQEGISMSWGILFRREINLTYARIQDIHLSSNIIERWLGLARIQVQTASGNAGAEMTIEGIREYEALRDFLYSRMRGTKATSKAIQPAEHGVAATGSADVAATLREVASELRALRVAIEARSGNTENHDV